MATDFVKLVVFVPESDADRVRQALGDAGAGKIGNYSHCTFSSRGFGRFLPLAGANPAIGEVGKPEIVAEERIETICPHNQLAEIISAMLAAHPYEEAAYDLYPLLAAPEGIKSKENS
jgi:hypothetical protein